MLLQMFQQERVDYVTAYSKFSEMTIKEQVKILMFIIKAHVQRKCVRSRNY